MDQNITVFMLGCTGSEDYLVANRLRMVDLLRVESISQLSELPPPPWQNVLLIVPWQKLMSSERHDILQALAASPTAALIIMARQLSTDDARGLMNGGLVAILDTPCGAETLEHHILHAAEELRFVRDQLERLHAAESRLILLTPRERDILRSLATGLSNKGVARELNLSPRTVEVHRANMIRRSGARNIAELLQMQFILDRAPPRRASPLLPVSATPKSEEPADVGPQPFAIPTEASTPSCPAGSAEPSGPEAPIGPTPYPQSPPPPAPDALARRQYYQP